MTVTEGTVGAESLAIADGCAIGIVWTSQLTVLV